MNASPGVPVGRWGWNPYNRAGGVPGIVDRGGVVAFIMRIAHLIWLVFGSAIVLGIGREPFGRVMLVMLVIGLGAVGLATAAALQLFRTVGAIGEAQGLAEHARALAATLGILSGAAMAMAAVVLIGGTCLKILVD